MMEFLRHLTVSWRGSGGVLEAIDNQPVLIGAGQLVFRDATIEDAPNPLDALECVSRAAADDANTLALRLKNRWRDGTTHILMERSELIERLVPPTPIQPHPWF